MSTTSLFDIPVEVLRTGTFPSCLTVNELLRLRRVCRRTKEISEDYLCRHPRPGNEVRLLLMPDDELEGPNQLLESFLDEDRRCSIKLPTSKFCIRFRDQRKIADRVFRSTPQLGEFLARYGNQIVRLKISHMNFPLGPNELRFYEKLPNLRRLNVLSVRESEEAEAGSPIVFPRCFANLRKLRVDPFCVFDGKPFIIASICKFLEYCTKLEYCVLPQMKSIPILIKILKLGHLKKINLNYMMTSATAEQSQHLADLMVRYNVKGTNACVTQLSFWKKVTLKKIAPQILSLDMEGFWHHNIPNNVTFPNLEKLCFWIEIENEFDSDWDRHFRRRSRKLLSPRRFPNLKHVRIAALEHIEKRKILPFIWHRLALFPHLEEITFTWNSSEDLEDAMFIGPDGYSPFLRLKGLKKLDLGRHLDPTTLSDQVFQRVFRNVRLREFRMGSDRGHGEPFETITSAGIRSLLTGPFGETIEVFPFRTWSLADLNRSDFQQLASEFPNNQPV